MPDPTSAPPARTSDPVRSDPRPPARPLPPTRIAGPAGYPAPGYAPPPGWSPGISPAGFSPAPAPYPARPVYVMPPPPMPPPRRGGGTIVVWVIVVFLLLILGICGGGYAYYNANKVRTQSLAACLTGTWRAQTDQVTVTMADGSDVRTTLTGGTVTREYLSTLDETVHWNTATYSGTYLGKPVTVVYAGSANYPVTTTGTDTIHVTARTIYVNVKLTVNGKTTSQDSVDLTDSSSRASCTDATLIVYNTDNSVRSTWVKLSS